MEFLYPAFLTALAAVAIPIIVHLFNFRRFKKIYFPNVKFIEEIQQRTRSHSQLKHLLVLACRILAIAALVFAFARPYIPSATATVPAGNKAVSIYLNNAFSMEAVAEDGALLEVAREKIRNIVSAYDETDRFQLLTNEFEGRHQRMVGRDEFLDLLDEVQIGPFQRELSDVMLRQKDALISEDAPQKKAYIISDLQEELVDVADWEDDSTISTIILPLRANESANLFIDSIWFDEPVRQFDRPDLLNVRIVNSGEDAVIDRSLKLHINGQQRALASYSIEANSFVDTSLAFTNTTTGIQKGKVSIEDHPVTYDDEMFFSFEVAASIDILEIHGHAEDLDLLSPMFLEDDLYKLTTTSITTLDPSLIAKSDLLVMHGLNEIPSGISQEIEKFVKAGGSVLLFPGTDIDLNTYHQFLGALGGDRYGVIDTSRTKVSELDIQAPLFRDILEKVDGNMDLPKVSRHYRITGSISSGRTDLMKMQNGDAFLSAYVVDGGNLYTCAVPIDPEWSNLTRHAFFVAIILRTAELSTPSGRIYYSIGGDEAISVGQVNDASPLHISNNVDMDMIPEIRRSGDRTELFVHDQIALAGNYDLTQNEEELSSISFNYDRSSSALNAISNADLESLIESNELKNISVLDLENDKITAGLLKELDEGIHLWTWFIALALIFLGLETALIRFWK